MKVIIEIETETISDLWTHIHIIGKEIKKECKKLKLEPLEDEFPPGTEWIDDNCYGEHIVKIEK